MIHIQGFLPIFITIGWCSGDSSPPNILFILADDLGWNDVPWNNPEVIAPTLARLAGEGLILENNYVQPTCTPSRAALMTGYYPMHTGNQYVPIRSLQPSGVPIKFNFLSQYLKNLGYSTHGVGKWHLGYCSPEYLPTQRGFDTFHGLWVGAGDHFLHTNMADNHDPSSVGYDFHKNEDIYYEADGFDTSALISERISEIIRIEEVNISSPFFIYAPFQDVHAPLEVQAEYEDLYPNEQDPTRRKYLGMVSRLDAAVERIVTDLEEVEYTRDGETRTLLEDTIIIFSSDNGGMSEGVGYEGGSNKPLRGRKGGIFEGGCRVPGFIYNSGRTGVTNGLFHITDWLPTIYAGLAGGNVEDLPEDINGVNQIELLSRPSGVSQRVEMLYEIINFEKDDWPDYALDLSGAFGAALRLSEWKIIIGCSTLIGCVSHTPHDRVLLFNLNEDPEERNDLSKHPEYLDIIDDLKKRVAFHQAQAVEPFRPPFDYDGLPSNHLPPGVYHTGWCQARTK